MAAGQARLLSITSRLSDNELRAQIINNNKMRLATESSQVSEAYIAALNEAQMMFTSYDKDNNASYQKLTFNALTAYNPYNNQYALTNSGGQVLLSESDSKNFEKANGNLETFLGLYGLEHKTTYFKQFDSVDFANEADYTGLELTGAELQALYEGGTVTVGSVGNIERNCSANMTAYDNTAASNTMYDYEKALENYVTSYSDYLEYIAQAEQGKFAEMLSGKFDYRLYNPNLTDILEKLSGRNGNDIKNDLKNLLTLIGGTAVPANTTNYFNLDPTNSTNEFIKLLSYTTNDEGQKHLPDDVATYLDNLQTMLRGYSTGQSVTIIGTLNTTDNTITNSTEEVFAKLVQNSTGYEIHYKQDDGSFAAPTSPIDGTVTIDDGKVTIVRDMTDEELRDAAKSIIKELAKVISNIWDADNDEWQSNTVTKDAYQRYLKNAKELFAVIYGEDKVNSAFSGEDGNLKVDDNYKEVVKNLANMPALYNNYDNSNLPFTSEFQQVFCNILLDLVMDTYGEPKYAWIDEKNANENGDAKAKWYTNLFELATKNGYKTLLDGLASSSEWIQFAFENGIVQMHQIDEHNAWNNVIYSNCSDITEQTDDKAIAIAEAEYNAAMNKIENKDKRYDLELKNIDTEHNSLQVEYDSIKTAIDKNIERNFKLYS